MKSLESFSCFESVNTILLLCTVLNIFLAELKYCNSLRCESRRLTDKTAQLVSPLFSVNDKLNALNWAKSNKNKICVFTSIPDVNRLTIEEIGGGNTNFNFKVYDEFNPSISCFVKHSKDYAKGFGESAKMSTRRLEYESNGMLEFEKYGFVVPDNYLYDSNENYLATSFLDSYEPFIAALQRGIVDFEIACAIGAIMGHCHAGTHREVIPTEQVSLYERIYQNKEHFDLWNDHFFPMSVERLKNTSLIIQSDNIAKFGLSHYNNVRQYIEHSVDKKLLLHAVSRVNNIYLNKKTTLIHGDLHCNNIMTQFLQSSDVESCSLDKVRLIDFEKFAYGPPALDVAQFLANYIYFMPFFENFDVVSSDFNKFEIATIKTWESYVEAFEMHSEVQCKLHNLCILPEVQNEILTDTLTEAVGFLGWWMFSLIVNCPVDVMPLFENVENYQNTEFKCRVELTRMNQLKIAVTALESFARNDKFENIFDVIKLIRNSLSRTHDY